MSTALLKARERGLRMDAWSERFDAIAWREVFEEVGIDPDFYALRERRSNEVLPWSMITLGIPTDHLLRERERAHAVMG